MRLDFHIQNRLKLSATYLAIIMFLCIMFSVIIFNASSNQISRGLRPPTPEEKNERNEPEEVRLIPNGFLEFERFRDDRIDESNNFLRRRLIYMNLYALVLGAVISYLLAKKALEPIEKAMEKQDRFASDASHEFRTPLAAMQSEIEVALRDKNLNVDEARETLESNLEEVKKMTAISSALLSLAHSENQSQEFVKYKVSDLVQDSLDECMKDHHDKVHVINDVPGIEVMGEPDQLKRLLSIILDNAVKYCDDDCKINIKTSTLGKNVVIEIADNGVGIDEGEQKFIFDRFFRSDSSRTKVEKSGYGLGLSIAKNIVELHNGQISAHTNVPSGTIIKIVLPKA